MGASYTKQKEYLYLNGEVVKETAVTDCGKTFLYKRIVEKPVFNGFRTYGILITMENGTPVWECRSSTEGNVPTEADWALLKEDNKFPEYIWLPSFKGNP